MTLWNVAQQAPLSMGFSRQEYYSGLPCPPTADLPNQGSNSCLLSLLQAGSLPLALPRKQSLNSSLLFVSFPVLLKRILFNVLFNLSFIFHGQVNLNNKVNCYQRAFQVAQWLRIRLPSRRCGFNPWFRKIPLEKRNSNPLQYSCLGNPTDRGAW